VLPIGLMGNTAFSGTYDRNPFNFEHFNLMLMQMSVYSDGQQQYGIKPLTTDFANAFYVRPNNTMFSGTGKVFKDAFDLTPDLREKGEDDVATTLNWPSSEACDWC